MSTKQLRLENFVVKTPLGEPVSRPLEFEVKPGDCVWLEGPNGVGKTSVLRAVLGQHRHFDGQILCDWLASEISMLPQMGNIQFFLPLTLRDVVCLDFDFSDDEILSWQLLSERELLRAWNSASGGERQKALLLRTLLRPAELYILDEPFNHLDRAGRDSVWRGLRRLMQSKKSVLGASHVAEGEGSRVVMERWRD